MSVTHPRDSLLLRLFFPADQCDFRSYISDSRLQWLLNLDPISSPPFVLGSPISLPGYLKPSSSTDPTPLSSTPLSLSLSSSSLSSSSLSFSATPQSAVTNERQIPPSLSSAIPTPTPTPISSSTPTPTPALTPTAVASLPSFNFSLAVTFPADPKQRNVAH